jgi:D-alanyl-D-alanine carboxypeptidase/D-alanyl-D-alanine-endopeptidase (penicillin-binding protein 4)
MTVFMSRLLFLSLALSIASGADLKSKIDELVSKTPALGNAFIGLQVVSLPSGRVLYERNPDRLFVPASNMKLFTTALALERLGPQYRFKTQIGSDTPIDADGTLVGDLVLVGGGDPTLSGREYPYQYHPGSQAGANYSFRAVEELADQLVARGLKRIDGDVVGDDWHYIWEPHGEGWSMGDALWEYGAPVSALILNDNSFAVTIRPAAHAGDLAHIALSPSFEYFSIDNRVRTEPGGVRKVGFDRSASGRQLHIAGVIPVGDGGMTELLAVDDPAAYSAKVLRDALLRRGIVIHGRAIARHRFSDETADSAEATTLRYVLAERTSAPLSEILRVVDKVSQNLHAEVMLREVGLVSGRSGSREGGLAEMHDFLAGAGISKDAYRFMDGSGLSRGTLVSPAAITKLLAYMYKSSNREVWMSLLPTAGVDGTLATRFQDHPEAQAIRAKTGSLSHIRAMSGYAESPRYGPVAFSFVVNNFDAPTVEVSDLLDQIGLALLE